MERAFAVISPDEPHEELALLAVGLAAGYWFGGDLERAAERARRSAGVVFAHLAASEAGLDEVARHRPRLVLALTEIGSQICRFLRVREGERIYRVVFGGCQAAATCGLGC
jgi:hypothetical protein